MIRHSRNVAIAAVMALIGGCSEPSTNPVAKPRETVLDPAVVGTLAARAMALAMAEPEIRQQILSDMRDSPFSEHKLVLQDYFSMPGGARVLNAIQRAGMDAEELRNALQDAQRIQFYVPNTAQRSSWRGTADVLVATFIPEIPSEAFNPTGEGVSVELRKGKMPSGIGALFILEWAEPMFHRWSGPTAATETIQLDGESQIGSGRVIQDAAGNTISTTDDTPVGTSRVTASATAGEPAGTYLSALSNDRPVCDPACLGEHLEFVFKSNATDDPTTYTSAELSGIGTYDDAQWYGLWQVHTSRAINGVKIEVQVREADGTSGDDPFYCLFGGPNCSPGISNWPYLNGTAWSFLLCEDTPQGCDPLYPDLEVVFTDRSTPVAQQVTVSPVTATINKDATQSYSATVRDQYGDVMPNKVVAWSSTNTAIATVASTGDLTGLATGQAGGQASIRASVDGITGSATLTVLAPATLTVSPSSATTCPSGINNKVLTATVLDQNGNVWSAGTVGWSSSNTGIATVTSTGSRTGNVAGAANGQATMTGTLDGATGQSTITVGSCPHVTISGPASVRPGATCAWFANASSGTPPYHYGWTPLGDDAPELIYTNSGENFNMQVWVSDANGLKALASRSITVSSSAPVCQF